VSVVQSETVVPWVFFNYVVQLGAFGLVLLLSLGLSSALNRPRDEQIES
jgi:hypothetical protein